MIVVFALFTLFPIYWALNSSFKDVNDVVTIPPTFLPPRFTTDAYSVVLGTRPGTGLINSIIVAASVTILAVVLGGLSGYAFSRYPGIRIGENTFFWILSVRMFPPVAAILPIFFIFKWVGLSQTYPGIILADLAFCIPLALWLMRSFIDELPRDVEEAAYLDGMSVFQTFARIVIPSITSGIAATAALTWVFVWNEFLFAYLLTGSQFILYNPALINMIQGERLMWNQIMALSMLALIPSLIVLMLFRKYLVRAYFVR
jgi:multiple sugar transport system permease protein